MRRPPNTAQATTTCRGCGATIAKGLTEAKCPAPVNSFHAATSTVIESLSAFNRSFARAVDEWATKHGHQENAQ